MKLNILGLVLGFVIGNSAITYAQTIYLPDVKNTICWDQNQGTLTEVNAWKVRVTYNNQPSPTDVNHTCIAGSPITCTLSTPIPLSLQTGTLSVRLEAASVQPDGSLSSYSNILTDNLTFAAPVPAPPAGSGSNLRIIKILQAIANFFKSIWLTLT